MLNVLVKGINNTFEPKFDVLYVWGFLCLLNDLDAAFFALRVAWSKCILATIHEELFIHSWGNLICNEVIGEFFFYIVFNVTYSNYFGNYNIGRVSRIYYMTVYQTYNIPLFVWRMNEVPCINVTRTKLAWVRIGCGEWSGFAIWNFPVKL